jgi:ABC-type transporter Mla subunit MlaD
VELTQGDPASGMLEEGGELSETNVEQTVELDELLRIFNPETKDAFRRWVSYTAKAIDGTSRDLNDALGNLPEFSTSGAEVLSVLDQQEGALEELIRNTGTVFAALNEQEGALQELIVNSGNTFEATASEQEALADTIEIFPTFLRESRLTLGRLEDFSRDTNPLVNDLKPVASDLGPTVRDLGDLSPDLQRVFRDFQPLIKSSRTTLPEAERFVLGAEPLFGGLHTFLPELNPVLSFANFHRGGLADFISIGSNVLNIGLPQSANEPSPLHMLSQAAMIGGNSADFQITEQRPFVRGNAYESPGRHLHFETGQLPSFSCYNNPGGEQPKPTEDEPPCVLQGPYGYGGGLYPQVRGLQEPLVGSGRVPRAEPFPQPGRGQAPKG